MANQKKKSSAGASAAQITEFFNALEALGTENSVEATVMIEKVKSAMQKAAVRMFPDCKENIRVDIDPPRRIFRVVLMQEVVDFEPSGNTQIFIDRAKLIDPDATLGTVIEHAHQKSDAQRRSNDTLASLFSITYNTEKIEGEIIILLRECTLFRCQLNCLSRYRQIKNGIIGSIHRAIVIITVTAATSGKLTYCK